MTSTNDILIANNDIYDSALMNAEKTASPWPSVAGGFGASNVRYIHNNIHQNYGEGLDFILISGGQATENSIWDNYSVNLYFDNATNILASRNLIYNTGDPRFLRPDTHGFAGGIQIANEGYSVSNPCAHLTIRNNLVIGGKANLYVGNYGKGGGLPDSLIANNDFYQASSDANIVFSQNGNPANFANTLIANNIFYQTNGIAMTRFDLLPAGITWKTNNWFGGSAGAGAGPGDVNLDPQLVHPGSFVPTDYKLKGTSPAINAGTSLSSVPNDYWLTSRPKGAYYDIGFHEYPY